jgi:uncharacterized protein YeaO (DUF488 family)
MIRVKRVYEPAAPEDGRRFLVDRLWPRGVKRATLAIEGWLRDAAPSDDLRRWYGHDPARWEEFQRRYQAELDGRPEAWRPLLDAAGAGDITLLYGARERQFNNAVALRSFLEARLTPTQPAGLGDVPAPLPGSSGGRPTDETSASHSRPAGLRTREAS